MDIPYFLQATSGAVESSSQTKITPNQQETTKGKDHEAPRGQPQKMSAQAHILAERRLTSWRSRVACKLLPEKQSISIFFVLFRLISRKAYIVRDYTRNYISFWYYFQLLDSPINSCITIFTAIFGTFHKTFFMRWINHCPTAYTPKNRVILPHRYSLTYVISNDASKRVEHATFRLWHMW